MKILFIFLFLLLLPFGLWAQPRSAVKILEDSIDIIPYVFEGNLLNPTFFLGDIEGIELKEPDVTWQDSIGIVNGLGTKCYPFIKSEIQVLHKYKWDQTDLQIVRVLNKVGGVEKVWFQVLQTGDTLIRYKFAPSKNAIYKFNQFVPGLFTSRRVFFCKCINPIRSKDYANRVEHSNLDIFVQFPLDSKSNTLLLDRSVESALFPLFYYREPDLMNLINRL